MNEKHVLSRKSFEKIVKQLVDIEENIDMFIHQYAITNSEDKDEIYRITMSYIEGIEAFIKNVDISDKEDSKVPVVVIGSKVTLLDLKNGETMSFKIVAPFKWEVFGDNISFISPLAKALLLKKEGDIVGLRLHDISEEKYKIVAISL